MKSAESPNCPGCKNDVGNTSYWYEGQFRLICKKCGTIWRPTVGRVIGNIREGLIQP
jgi:ribosomal protein S27E